MNDPLTREIFGNLNGTSRAVFYVLACASLVCSGWGVWRGARKWRLGRPRGEPIDWSATLRRALSPVLSQGTVRRGRRGAGRAHAMLFWGFSVLLVGTLLVAVEHYAAALLGREPTDPLFHKGAYYAVFEVVLDAGGLVLLAGCGWFCVRRWRATSSMDHRTSDSLVLSGLAGIAVSGYLVEAARIVREQTPLPGLSFVGWGGARLLQAAGFDAANVGDLHWSLWWLHAIAALTLIAAFPYCRLLHVIAGTVQLVTTTRTLGAMQPVSMEQLEQTGQVGVQAVTDWTRQQLMSLDACVSCGRCQDACPAFAAGKPLSPRDLVQDLRAHLDRTAPLLLDQADAGDSPPPLHGEAIGAETLWSCTTCSACVDVCPLGVHPLELITDMRRYLIGEGQLRGAPAASLQKMQRSGNPWGFPARDRFAWAEGLDVPTVEEHPDFEILYWVGCAAAYDRRVQRVARAVVKLLKAARVNFACLGSQERCTGESARRMGDEFLFQELAAANIETLARHQVRKIVTHCPHCLNSLRQDYAQFGGHYEVVHHSQLLAQLAQEGRLPVTAQVSRRLTYHDPCYLARVRTIVDPPRQLVQSVVGDGALFEMPRHGRDTACCGGGGGRMWFDDSPGERIGRDRVREALDTAADTVCVACPFCLTMLHDGVADERADVAVRDIAELLADAVEGIEVPD